uniref:Uncharacterized protein n=1 Tax=Arundo donax TaxID=35708 RepID=A0A0A9FG18_ARUDO
MQNTRHYKLCDGRLLLASILCWTVYRMHLRCCSPAMLLRHRFNGMHCSVPQKGKKN